MATLPKLKLNVPAGLPNLGLSVGSFSDQEKNKALTADPRYTKPTTVPNQSVGVKTTSPTDNIKKETNTTPQPKKTIAPNTTSSTDNGTTGQTVPQYGSSIIDSAGRTGTAMFDPNTGKPLVNPNQTTATPPEESKNNGLYGQIVNDLAGKSLQSGPDYQAAQAEAQRISDEQTKLAQDYSQKTNNIAGTAGFLTQQSGLQGQLNNQYNTVQNALSSQYTGATNRLGAANTQQGLLQQALQQAGALAAPTGNIINVDPITGLPVAGGSLGELAKTAGQVQGIQTGAAANAAAGGQTSAQNQIALGTAATGANARSIGDFTNQINTTQKSISTLNNLANQIVPNMSSEGFNPTSSPIGNQTFSKYYTEKNPAAKAGIIAGLGELKNQISNVISSATGLTPTGVTAVTDAYDLTTLNPQQLHDFLQYIDQYAKSNINAAQDSINLIAQGKTPNATPGKLPDTMENSTGQAIAGTGAGIAKGLIEQVWDKLSGAVSGAVAGGAAGAAAKVLQ